MDPANWDDYSKALNAAQSCLHAHDADRARVMASSHKLTNKEFWIDAYDGAILTKYPLDNDHFKLLFGHVQARELKTVIEVGSYPGPFLAALGEIGVQLNGIDFHPGNAVDLPKWLRHQGFEVGLFANSDFLEITLTEKFDLVYSIGFIEHFVDFEEILRRHTTLVARGGYLFISAPNFAGKVQHLLHWVLDRENLAKHYLPAMAPKQWAKILKQHGFEVLFSGYYGQAAIWFDHKRPRGIINRVACKFLIRLFWNLRKIFKFDSPHFSAFCGIVARKP